MKQEQTTLFEDEHTAHLVRAFLALHSEEECRAFLSDICTRAEIQEMSRRLRAAALLRAGTSYLDVAAETGLSGLKQSAIDEVCLDAAGITLVCNGESTTFRYADYNYEDIQDTDCLPAVAEYLVQHLRGYYNIARTFFTVTKSNGHTEEKTREVLVTRHHEDTPFTPSPVQKQRLF